MSERTCILILCKNPILGSVKTRLASSVGAQKALEIYRFLLQHTAQIVAAVPSDKRIYYSEEVLDDDVFQGPSYHKGLQTQGDLGQRMRTAFEEAFAEGYERVLVIGSDCYDLSSALLNQALSALNNHDVVLGPAQDGGYYLLGLRQLSDAPESLLDSVFEEQPWSQDNLLQSTLNALSASEDNSYTYLLLPELSDVDYLEDLPLKLRAKFKV
jgi:rSAM/selenodomain-associated transferase 1